jgi:hypothetical protein
MGVTCGPCAYGCCTESVKKLARTSSAGDVLRGKRFAFMACDCVSAVDQSFRNLRAVTKVPLFSLISLLNVHGSFQNAITYSS